MPLSNNLTVLTNLVPDAEAGVTAATNENLSFIQNEQLMMTVGAGAFVLTLSAFVARKLARMTRARTDVAITSSSGTAPSNVASSSWELNDAAVAAQKADALPPLNARTMQENDL